MSETTRTFFAIEIPGPLGRELNRLQDTLAPELTKCRWTTGDTPFHTTLAFLGDVRNRDLSGLHQLVASSVRKFEPCALHFEGLGAFPSSSRPRVLWAGLSARKAALFAEIRSAVAGAAAKAGYPCTDDRFHAHVTLGRFKPDRRGACDATAVVERYRSWSCGDFTALEVIGFASRHSGAGPTYEALSRARLEGEKSESLP
jgi:RNA 2',3'-cyclic 3'-phosphodiesterase